MALDSGGAKEEGGGVVAKCTSTTPIGARIYIRRRAAMPIAPQLALDIGGSTI